MRPTAKQRITKLEQKLGGRLRQSYRRMLKLVDTNKSNNVVDVIVFWPPDQNDGMIATLAETNRNGESVVWDFEIAKSSWILRGDKLTPEEWFPANLLKCVLQLFRNTWRGLDSDLKRNVVGYFSLHDSSVYSNLSNGRECLERERVDFLPPEKKPAVPGRSIKPPKKEFAISLLGKSPSYVQEQLDSNGDRVALGDSHSIIDFRKQGVWLMLDQDKVVLVRYSAPFSLRIGKVWIGCHASDVNRILGEPEHEAFWFNFKIGNKKAHRYWLFRNGNLRVSFDSLDVVMMIEQGTNRFV